ncbi:hypothetical protein IQ07DRAFT_513709 [Pyrenochaeta sp. DS3sAY3a]|nr:hypothetical protein IQ07DRAFT_513709 [Pyrenochaeta sp. DS3sAY3a]
MPQTRQVPFRLVTVNTAPERAKLVVGRMIEGLKDRYDIEHVANCSTIEEVAPTIRVIQPNVLFTASMWSPQEAAEIREIAEREVSGIQTHSIPQGLQVEKGPDGVVEYLLETIPSLLNSIEV